MSELTPAVTETNFDQDVLRSGVPVLVDFWAQWCGPCRAIAPVLEELAESYKGKIKIMKLNVDENGNLASRFGVMSIPTLILFKGGKEADRIVGLVPRDEIERRIQRVLG